MTCGSPFAADLTTTRALTVALALTVSLLLVGCAARVGPSVVTLSGGEAGYVDGSSTTALFREPVDVSVDAQGYVYVADLGNRRVRKLSPGADSSWTVATLAGSAGGSAEDGPALAVAFGELTGLSVGPAGDVYVADSTDRSQLVRTINAQGTVITLAGGARGYRDGPGSDAQFGGRAGLAVDPEGNVLVADTCANRIRLIGPDGLASTVAGPLEQGWAFAAGYADGPAAEARFYNPRDVAVDQAGDIYVADTANHTIRLVSRGEDGSLVVTTLAGAKAPGFVDGARLTARFNYPRSIAVDGAGNLYVADMGNHAIRQITPQGVVSTVAGTGAPGYADGPAYEAQFRVPEGVAVDPDGNLIVADTGNHRIRKIVLYP
jgi:sugar lactone lactonase YvrE